MRGTTIGARGTSYSSAGFLPLDSLENYDDWSERTKYQSEAATRPFKNSEMLASKRVKK